MPDSPLPIPPPQPSAIADHLSEAIHAIDAAFGDGYARDHPELVASLKAAPSKQPSQPAMPPIRKRWNWPTGSVARPARRSSS